MREASLFGLTLGDMLMSIAVFAPLFALLALGVGALTMTWSRGRMRAAGRKTTLPTVFIVLAVMVALPLVSCGAGVKYSMESALAEAIENGGKMIGRRITETCDPRLRRDLQLAEDAVVELAATRVKLRALMHPATHRIDDLFQSAYVGAVDVSSYTFLGGTATWRELRERAQMVLSKPSNKLLEKILGSVSSAAHGTIIGWMILLAVANGLVGLVVLLVARKPPSTGSPRSA